MGWYQWIGQYPRSVPPEPRSEHPSWLCVSASCIVVFFHEFINFDYLVAQCWIILQLADFEQKEWILVFFLFPPFHHYYCLIYTCVEVFFYCLGWLRYTFSFIHLNKIFFFNYKIVLVLLVFRNRNKKGVFNKINFYYTKSIQYT